MASVPGLTPATPSAYTAWLCHHENDPPGQFGLVRTLTAAGAAELYADIRLAGGSGDWSGQVVEVCPGGKQADPAAWVKYRLAGRIAYVAIKVGG